MQLHLGACEQGGDAVSLVLSGMIVSGIFTALLTIVQFLADPFRLQTIVHWTMGNLHNAEWRRVLESAPIMAIGGAGMFFLRWRMNILALGDQEAYAVGVNPEREKIKMLIPATLAASAAVAAAGIIGMVGLVVPHMVRMMLGPITASGSRPAFFSAGPFSSWWTFFSSFDRLRTAHRHFYHSYRRALLHFSAPPIPTGVGLMKTAHDSGSSPANEAALCVRKLRFAYGDAEVLRRVSFDIKPRSFTVLLGRNGSGKSTLFRLLVGLLKPREGSIAVFGRELHQLPLRERSRLLGFLPQHHHPVFPFSVEDVVLTGRAAHVGLVPKAHDRAVVREALEQLGIEHLIAKPYTELSGGEQQLVLIARVLAQKPKVLPLGRAHVPSGFCQRPPPYGPRAR